MGRIFAVRHLEKDCPTPRPIGITRAAPDSNRDGSFTLSIVQTRNDSSRLAHGSTSDFSEFVGQS